LSVAAYIAGSGLHCRYSSLRGGESWDEEEGVKKGCSYIEEYLSKAKTAKTKQPMQNLIIMLRDTERKASYDSASSVDSFVKYTDKI
jgi:hypothetical protein